MPTKRIHELTNATTLNALDKVPVDRSGGTARSILATDFATAVRPFASTLEAQTGTATDKTMTPATTFSAFDTKFNASTTAFSRTILDDTDAATARTTLGLGNSATRNVGTGTGTVAAGDDARLSDQRVPTDGSVTAAKMASGAAATNMGASAFGLTLIDDANASAARTTLGLGGSATLNVGTGAGTVAAGDDARLSDQRVPTDNSATNAKLADMAQATIKGRAAGAGTGDPQDLTPAQARAAIGSPPKEWIDVDVRDSQFAGGAPWNGVDNDQPAIQAAIDYGQTLGSLYNAVGLRINLPAGTGRIASGTLDFTDAHGVRLRGAGKGATYLKQVNNQPVLYSNNTTSLPLHFAGAEDMTLDGPGLVNALAHGIDFNSNNRCEFKSLRIIRCRSGVDIANSWQTVLDDMHISLPGGLQCLDGIYQRDGNLAVVENALEIRGGIIEGCARYGYRGESITGTKVFGLEVLNAANAGVYLGDSPGNKPLQWFTWVGGLIDTCPDLLVVKKGGSTVAELLHFSGLWMGYASESPGNGIAAEFNGIREFVFRPDIIVNCGTAAYIANCAAFDVNIGGISKFDRLGAGSFGIAVENSTDGSVNVGYAVPDAAATTGWAIIETGTSARNSLRVGNSTKGVYAIPGNGSVIHSTISDFGFGRMLRPARAAIVTKAQLPAASSEWAGHFACVTDEVGGYTMAFCDGAAWRRVQDRVIVS